MTGNVIISDVDAVMYVVVSKAENTRFLRGVSWWPWMYDVIVEVSH